MESKNGCLASTVQTILTFLIVASVRVLGLESSDICSQGNMPNGSRCTCETSVADEQSYFQINCVNASLIAIPDNLPQFPVMKFEGNNLQILGFVSYPSLKNLFLNNNNIRFIRDYSFSNLSNVNQLHLQNNKISGLSRNTFHGLSELKVLFLRNNTLYELERNTFSGDSLPKLEILTLSNCRLVRIHRDTFQNAMSLKLLDLSDNMLTAPIQFFGNLRIDTLNLSSNRLENLANSPFQQLKFLQKLFLSNNLISNLTAADFKGLTRLTILGLNNNSISSVEINALKVSDELDLSMNRLRTVAADCFSWNDLSKLYVYHNPWNCDCHTQWLHSENVVIEWNLDKDLR